MSREGVNPEGFGFEPDENGDTNFLSVYTDFEVNSFDDYKEVFKKLFSIAIENPGIMPILVLNDETKN